MTEQSAVFAAAIDGPPDGDSCEGQCGFADFECAAGSRHVASHHARAGAAAPMVSARIRIENRFTAFSIAATAFPTATLGPDERRAARLGGSLRPRWTTKVVQEAVADDDRPFPGGDRA